MLQANPPSADAAQPSLLMEDHTIFGHKKARYNGLAKNTAQIYSLFGLVNLALAKNKTVAPQGTLAS
jgi:IS5 family transposase